MPQPYTVKFGPWLPDLQNVGVEMPFQWTETELPLADCENVYYQDAAYRCLPAPASFAPSLGIPILACFTWYDDAAGKEVVFAATASGFYQLIDNVWTQIQVQQNASSGTVGYAVSLGMGTPFAVAVYLTPSSESQVGTTTSYTFGSVTANVGNGSPSGYNWTFSGQTGPGSWNISSGQGTSVATPQVTGQTENTTSTATLNCAITINGVAYNCSAALSYQNAKAPQQVKYTSGSGTQTVPAGYNTVVIEIVGGGGGGEDGFYNSQFHEAFGGDGGSSGSYSRSSYSCSPGQTINYSVGANSAAGPYHAPVAAGTSTATSGTLGITSMSAPGGNTKNSPSGGNQANVDWNNGTTGSLNNAGVGGAAISGEYISGYGAGGNAGLGAGDGYAGAVGVVSFYFSYVP